MTPELSNSDLAVGQRMRDAGSVSIVVLLATGIVL